MNVRRVLFAAAVMGGAYLVPGADAALIATDPSAMAGFKGTQSFPAVGPGGLTFHANVEYAVYAPGAFQTSSVLGNPTDPSGGSQYVYAYILSNTGTSLERTVGQLSVGLDGDTQSANIGVLASVVPSGISPSSAFVPAVPPFASATWIHTPELTSGQTSNILMYTSPNAPHFFNASVLGGALQNQQTLPSPVPEPSSLMVLSGLLLLASRAGRTARRAD